MPSKITLIVTEGNLSGQTFEFEERTTCLVGRAKDCQLKLPNKTEEDRKCSRHHCLLDINPPDIRVRDLGSLNGTKVNDKVIGKRKKGQTREEAAGIQFREHDLKSGDKIQIGTVGFRVDVYAPAFCAGCGREIPEERKAECKRGSGVYLCGYCQTQVELSKTPHARQCIQCGRDVSAEIGSGRQGEYVCAACQADPLQIIRQLLELAKSGERDLVSIKDYEIEKRLGRGGMGAVYLARNTVSGQRVALKVMLPQVAANEHSRKQFLREIKNTAALQHPNVVKLYDHGYSQGTFFFTLELCKFQSVDKVVKKQGGTIPVRRAVDITLQVLQGLEYAHNVEVEVELKDGSMKKARGLVHRDLSPQNILLTGSSTALIAKVSDFGLAKAFDTAGLSGMTRTGSSAGKPYYMPRQQVVDYSNAKPEVDVWAMAACLYQMLTGHAPRDFHKGEDRWLVILESKPVPIRQRVANIPSRLAEVIDAALQDDPKILFQSAKELRRALEGAI